VAELQIRLPYTAWGAGDEWQEGYEDLLGDLFEVVDSVGLGETDDPDHFDDFICFYLDGDDLESLCRAAGGVLARRGLLEAASAMVTDPEANDMEVGSPVDLSP
jgi:hypothetical protein